MDLGAGYALLAAFLWTCSSMMWGLVKMPAFTLNACKNCVGVALVGIHLAIVSFGLGWVELSADLRSWSWLALSGLVGIVIGDTMYFRSLQILGPRRAMVIACLAPFFAALLGLLFLGQEIAFLVVLGIGLTMTGVVVVVLDRKAKQEEPGLVPGKLQAGVACGVIAAACQSTGGLFAFNGMFFEGKVACTALEAAAIRLLAAAVATTLWLLSRQKYRQAFVQTVKLEQFRYIVPATAMGTWLGVWLCQKAYQNDDLAIAQTLLATCPLFAIPVMWILYRHRVSRVAFIGTVVAIFGIWLTVKHDAKPSKEPLDEDHNSLTSVTCLEDNCPSAC